MAPLDSLAAAGSSTYSSDTMYVGDGTWDSTKNDFLLPPLVGLNFATMRYNGQFCVLAAVAFTNSSQAWEIDSRVYQVIIR